MEDMGQEVNLEGIVSKEKTEKAQEQIAEKNV